MSSQDFSESPSSLLSVGANCVCFLFTGTTAILIFFFFFFALFCFLTGRPRVQMFQSLFNRKCQVFLHSYSCYQCFFFPIILNTTRGWTNPSMHLATGHQSITAMLHITRRLHSRGRFMDQFTQLTFLSTAGAKPRSLVIHFCCFV